MPGQVSGSIEVPPPGRRAARRGGRARFRSSPRLGAIAWALAAAACGGGDGGAGAPAAWRRNCTVCHGDDGTSARASQIAGRRVDLADPGWQAATSDSAIRFLLDEGRNSMPSFLGLPESDLAVILRHLRSLPGDGAPAEGEEVAP